MLAWLTDLHWDFADDRARASVASLFEAQRPSIAVVTGDLTHGDRGALLAWLQDQVPEVYYVLGNHDYYTTQPIAHETLADRDDIGRLWHLPVRLSHDTVLVGVDGWGDGCSGLGARSRVGLSDLHYIPELRALGDGTMRATPAQFQWYERRAAADARQLQRLLTGVRARRVIVACHVPPWREAAWHQGRMGDDDAAPFFTWSHGGEVIEHWADAHPDTEVVVLCGHTHSGGVYRPRANVVCYTGASRYGAPRVVSVFDEDRGYPAEEQVVRTW